MTQENIPLKVLIVGGGQYLEPFLDGEPLYIRLLLQLRLACTEALEFYMSVRDMHEILRLPVLRGQAKEVAQFMEPPLRYLYTNQQDTLPDANPPDSNKPNKPREWDPLLAAHRLDRTCRWLVVSCNYPLIQSTDIRQLHDSYEAPVTCFMKPGHGYPEPLLAIWSPESLKKLEDNISNGMNFTVVAMKVVDALKGKLIRPARKESLFHTSNYEDWAEAMTIALRMIIEESENTS
ncbi:uncharacterized protein K452DRAFT_282902 [Aplosporella prunicola CBS 121167]|uniref:Uncharacterized protein n=1 Tax=Aplosporella prunicola CBS 121167 TaxID=1176127 RepID=A0A6A6BTW8_9PEZI|nr:uncharacterized protein K452DRAFT_282902 [Aplosporella prunicola CBS 121167]KAF2146715.1 hypothetical protein K452DRAFT_282902 [Aplosporella prunicola CBS 121167]